MSARPIPPPGPPEVICRTPGGSGCTDRIERRDPRARPMPPSIPDFMVRSPTLPTWAHRIAMTILSICAAGLVGVLMLLVL